MKSLFFFLIFFVNVAFGIVSRDITATAFGFIMLAVSVFYFVSPDNKLFNKKK